MRIVLSLLFSLALFGGWREANISAIEHVIAVYQTRLQCLQHDEAISCIQKHPLDPRSDALAKTFSMSFPSSYYRATLKRDIAILQKEKLCYGRARSEMEAKRCSKP